MRAGGGGGVSKYKNTPLPSSTAMKRFFSEPRIFYVNDDSGLSALLGQTANVLNFYDDSGRCASGMAMTVNSKQENS
jgi:hypothetical protein